MADKISTAKKMEQEERLNKKHIQTLGYVQELMKENKKLKQIIDECEQQKLHCDELHAANDAAQAKIKQIQEQYMNRADEINQTLVQKHQVEMQKILEEKCENEKRSAAQISQMAAEIDRLSKLNGSLEEALAAKTKMSSNHGEVLVQLDHLKKQIALLTGENRDLQSSLDNQLSEIKSLQSQLEKSKDLKTQLASSQQTIKSQDAKIASLEKDLEEANQVMEETQQNLIQSLKQKLIKANETIGSYQARLEKKENELMSSKAELRQRMEEIENIETERYKAKREVELLKQRITELEQQIRLLSNNRGKEAGSFKEFVAIKRELALVQEENTQLKERLIMNRGSSAKLLKSRQSLK